MQPEGPKLLPKLLVTSALGTALYQTWPLVAKAPYGADWGLIVWGLGAVATIAGAYGVATEVGALVARVSRTFRAFRPKESPASAKWLTTREARKAGLGNTEGLFLGILEGQPLFVANAVHGLTCAPARKGKTTSFVLPALCHDFGASCIAADMKGDLAVQTGEHREQVLGQIVIYVNPAHQFGKPNMPYNPMQIILDDLAFAPQDVIADARSMATQIHAEAPGGDRDPFWPNGTRKMLVFAVVAQCALRGEHDAHLPRVYEILGDDRLFDDLLSDAKDSTVLGGELAAMARNIKNVWDENPKHFESFREGALQSLAPFGPSGRLAPSMQSCAFRFSDLKKQKTTLYLICDYSRMDVFAPWLGLIIWAALKELVRENNDTPVYFLLDEFTNYRLSGLPNALTALGSYGIRCWMLVQELDEIARAYGREALSTILSQTDVKQFFGVASDQTAQLVSRMLGEEELNSESFGLGHDVLGMPSLNLGRRSKPLLKPDQIRRLPDDEQIVFIKNLRAARLLKVGSHEIDPFRRQIKPNPLHGNKPFLGRVKMRIKNGVARATRAGRRKIERPKRPLLRPLLASLAHLVPGPPVLLLAGAVLTVATFGWPHLRIQYTRSFSWCSYAGLPFVSQSFVLSGQDNCPLVLWRKSGGRVQ